MNDDIYFSGASAFGRRPTLLYGVRPMGTGTADVESLHSYLLSVAYAHRLGPTYIARVVLPQLTSDSAFAFWDRGHGSRLIGSGQYALRWAQTLGAATGQEGLEHTTLNPLSGLICNTHLVDKSIRVCLACCREDLERSGRTYGRLLWRLMDVVCCPLHKLALTETTCCAPVRATSHDFRRVSLYGVCAGCAKSGYACQTVPTSLPTESELRVAENCSALIEMLPNVARLDATFVKSQVAALGDNEGGLARIAKEACIPKSLLSRWLHEPKARLSLRAFCDLSDAIGLRLLDLLKGDIAKAEIRNRLKSDRVRRPVKHLDVDALAYRIAEVATNGGSITALARESGVDRGTLRRIDRRRYEVIAERSKAENAARNDTKNVLYIETAVRVLRNLLEAQLTPSLRNARELTGQAWPLSNSASIALLLLRRQLGDLRANVPLNARRFGKAFMERVHAEGLKLQREIDRQVLGVILPTPTDQASVGKEAPSHAQPGPVRDA